MGPELKDVQINYASIPTTPAKPDSTAKQLICCNWKEKHLVDANWVEPSVLIGCCSETRQVSKILVRETQCQAMPACPGLVAAARGFNSRQAGDTIISHIHGDSIEAGFTSVAAENAISRTDFIATGFHPCRYFTISCENSSVVNQDSLPEENFEDEVSSIPNVCTDGSSISSRPFFHQNVSSETITDSALVKSKSPKFEPITPDKTSKVEQRQESALQVSTTDGEHTEKGAHENNLVSDELKEFYMKEKQSHSCVMTSTLPSENQKPEKEGTKDAELSKTHHKPRKKKHRPKVIIEGQPKKTPMSSAKEPTFFPEDTSVKRKHNRKKRGNDLANTPSEGDKNEMDANKEPSGTKDTPTEKRKCERKKGINKPEDSILDEENTNTTERKTVQFTRRSSRRSLNFDMECQEKDETSLYCPSNSGMKLQAENVNSEDHLTATVQCREEMEIIEKKK